MSSAVQCIRVEVEALLDELYDVRDHCFESNKEQRISSLQKRVFDQFETVRADGNEDEALINYWHGKALDVEDNFSKKAQEHLQQAVKLNASLTDAWNCLGNSYWKDADLKNARSCIMTALSQDIENTCALRYISIILRSIAMSSSDPEKKIETILESVKYARRAVSADPRDDVLGNALLSKFFSASLDRADLNQSFKAYQQSEKSKVNPASGNPDMYFNRANVLRYFEDYPKAIEDFRKAQEIDSMLPAGDMIDSIERFVAKMVKLVTPSKSKTLLKKMVGVDNIAESYDAALSMYEKSREELPTLPQYSPGTKYAESREFFTQAQTAVQQISSRNRSNVVSNLWFLEKRLLVESRPSISLEDMSEGKNDGHIFVCKFLMPVYRDTEIPISMIVISKGMKAVAVSVYSVSSDACSKLNAGDTIFIADPTLQTIELDVHGETLGYQSIQVTDPSKFVCDCSPLPLATPSLRVQTRT